MIISIVFTKYAKTPHEIIVIIIQINFSVYVVGEVSPIYDLIIND